MKNKSATRYFSSKQEKKVAKTIGGKTTANSGATKFSKGDVTTSDGWLIECKTKTTPSKSITIQREWIEKNEEEAFSMGKSHSAVCFSFGDLHNDQNYYILSERDFLRLLKYEREESENGKDQ